MKYFLVTILLFLSVGCFSQPASLFWSLNTQKVKALNSGTIYWGLSLHSSQVWTTAAEACGLAAGTTPEYNSGTFYYSGTLGNGTYIYNTSTGDNARDITGASTTMGGMGMGNYYSLGLNTHSLTLTQGLYGQYYVSNYAACITSYAFTFDGYPTTWTTCNAARISSTGGTAMYAAISYMSNSPTPTITRFFHDAALTTPFVGAGAGTYYSVSVGGTKYGCEIDSNGYLLSYSSTC
jgi:hypothetical protein